MKNMKVYKNNCKTDIMLGLQLEKEYCEYNLGYQLQATTHKGHRANQEDEVLILEHPKNKNNKLIAVADGVGGTKGSEQASNYLLQNIAMLFETIDFKNNQDLNSALKIVSDRLEQINKEIINKKLGQTTLSMAIITERETAIINAGDSRIYTYTDGELKQETTDDSVVQQYYENRIILSKDMMRFHKRSNQITNCFGTRDFYIKTKIIPNHYEMILGVTDGVTDCLSDQELEETINQNQGTQIASAIVCDALYNESTVDKEYIDKEEYLKVIKGGKDNTSAVVYQRKL